MKSIAASRAPNRARFSWLASGENQPSFGAVAAASRARPWRTGTTMSRSPCNTKSGAATRPMRDNEFEAVAHQQHRRDKRVMALRGGGDAGEGRFEDEGGDLMPRGQVDGDARAEQLAPQHDFVRLDPRIGKKVERRLAIGEEPGFARHYPDCRHSRDIPRAAPHSRRGQDGAGVRRDSRYGRRCRGNRRRPAVRCAAAGTTRTTSGRRPS